jgi:hypothetical protein
VRQGTQILKFQALFSTVVALSCLLMTWLTLADGSPFGAYFARHRHFADTWRMTTTVPFLLSAVVSRNPHSPPIAAFIGALFVQWSLVGFLLSIPIAKWWAHRQETTPRRASSLNSRSS